ncbi:MAG: glycosyltransferase family 10, partial [Candidatus Pacearchaeota archaeon]|nr:glycosyltransferase family 10 [Candidatus Pacearchaeota archaeon]
QEIPIRNHFFKMLSEYKRIDSPGRCMNNMLPIGSNNPRKSRFSESWVKEKVDFIKPYKFTIAFENCAKPGYVSEKLTHPMLVNSIPIYFGHKDVKRDFNTKSFINASDFKSMEEVIEYIIKIDNDDKLYEKILREPWYNETKLPEYFSDQRILNRFKEIFG